MRTKYAILYAPVPKDYRNDGDIVDDDDTK